MIRYIPVAIAVALGALVATTNATQAACGGDHPYYCAGANVCCVAPPAFQCGWYDGTIANFPSYQPARGQSFCVNTTTAASWVAFYSKHCRPLTRC